MELHLGFIHPRPVVSLSTLLTRRKEQLKLEKTSFLLLYDHESVPAFHPLLLNPTSLTSLISLAFIHTGLQLFTCVHHRPVSTYGGGQESLFWAWVAFLNIILCTFIYLPVNSMIFFLFTAEQYSLGDTYHVSFIPLLVGEHLCWFHFLAVINSTAAIAMQINSSALGYGVWGSMPRSGIAGLCAGSIFSRLRTLQTDFHDNGIKFHSHQQWMGALLSHVCVRFLNDSLGRLDDISG